MHHCCIGRTLFACCLQERDNELMAYKYQVEELHGDLEAERQSHARTKANSQSLNQQLRTMHQELATKKKQVWKRPEKRR